MRGVEVVETTFELLEEDVPLDRGQPIFHFELGLRVQDLLVLDESGFVEQHEPVLGAVPLLQSHLSSGLS